MKTIHAFFICSSLILTAGISAEAATPPVPNTAAVEEVQSGKRKEARASWWGFDPADSTVALQAAINSGARKLVVENTGTPWITDKLHLASNQEIVFEKGVVVQAKRGVFKGTGDSLFSASSKTNITLTGYGATLKMWKQDYDDKVRYKHAEWRHVLDLHSCSRVRIAGLTLADSGGDGIYLGVARKGVPCSDTVIQDVICDNNYRQGISVISAHNLLIENCVLKNTWGTAPMAGIDFEPNEPSDELVNCVMRNCISEDNRSYAYVFSLNALKAFSAPVSFRLQNCRSRGCSHGVYFGTGSDPEQTAAKGRADFVRCTFEGSQQAGIMIANNPAGACRIRFTDCAIINAATNKPTMSPITLTSAGDGLSGFSLGGVQFVRCAIHDPLERPPMSYHDMAGGAGLSDVSGTLVVNHGGRRIEYALTQQQLDAWFPHLKFKDIKRFDTHGVRFEPVLPSATAPAARRNSARQRGHAEYLLWAEAGQQAAFSMAIRPVGKLHPKPIAVRLVSPSGKGCKLPDAQGDQETPYSFTPDETGAYKIVCDPGSWSATVNSTSNRVCLNADSSAIHFVSTTGEFFFWVPAGTGEFAVKVAGDNPAERIKAALRDPDGRVVEEKDSIAEAHQFVAKPRSESTGEIWSLRLDKPTIGIVEDFHVQLQGIPPVVSHTRESLLKPAK